MNIKKKNITQLVAVVGLVSLLPACWHPFRKKKEVVICEKKEEMSLPTYPGEYEDTLVFDEAAEELILEEGDEANDLRAELKDTAKNMLAQGKEMVKELADDVAEVLDLNTPELELDYAQEPEQLAAVVYFPYDQDAPRADQEKNMKTVVEKAKEIVKQGKKVACKGHACDYGSRCRIRNLPLSMKRAEAVANQLVTEAGIEPTSIKVFGVGAEEMVAFEHGKDAQAPNRRVEIYALGA